MKTAAFTPRRTCSWCETTGPAGTHCAHCGVEFPTIRHDDLPKPAPRDRYSEAERAAFSQLYAAAQGAR